MMKAMRLILIVLALTIVGLATTWLLAGRQIVLILDRISLIRTYSNPTGPFIYSPGSMTIGNHSLETSSPDGRVADFRVDVDANGRLALRAGGGSFPLGTRVGPPDYSGRPDIPFAPDPGDDVGFGVDYSLFGWPTLFEMNFMTGHAPTRRHNVYFHLIWRKRSGAVLDMLWRYEQAYYAPDGWSPSWMAREGSTGLIHVSIIGAANR
jgi:hypothetical protein